MKKPYTPPRVKPSHLVPSLFIVQSILKSEEHITDISQYDFLGREDDNSSSPHRNIWNTGW